MTRPFPWLAALPFAALFAVSGAATAQDSPPPAPPAAEPPAAEAPAEQPPAEQPPGDPAGEQAGGGQATAEQPAGEAEAATEEAPSPLATWNPASIENPIAATDLIGATVTDARGNALGAVEDVAVSQNDLSVIAIVLAEGRALDWAGAQIARDGESLVVTAQGRPGRLDAKQFEDSDALEPGRQAEAVRVSELLDKDMLLNDRIRYGDVVDLIFDGSGLLVAAEAQYNGPTVTRYALPVPPEAGLDPDADHVLLPFDFKDVKNMAPVEVDAG